MTLHHKPGIYFGMSAEEYHDDPALGSTDIKEIALDPIEYQFARLHGAERKETWALKWGNAVHTRALEGRAAFVERHPVEPEKADYPGLLDTAEELKARCAELDVKPAGRLKADAIAAIRTKDKDTPIWEEIQARFAETTAGKVTIPKRAVAEIEQAVAWMQQDKRLAPVMVDGTMVAGASEVSIFYEDDGVRLKARLDHLLSHANIDIKSFRPVFAERVKRAAVKAIERQRYDLQAADYMRALKNAVPLYRAGQVFNNRFDPEFLDTVFRLVELGEFQWVWVLIKATGAPQPVVREFNLKSAIYRNASMEVERAIADFRHYSRTFGPNTDWAPNLPAEVLSDEDFAPYAFM